MSEVVDVTQTPAVSDTPATPAPVQSAPVTPQTTPAVNTQPPATGGEAVVPSYRLRQIREQYERTMAQKEAEWQAKYEQTQRQLHSLVGVTPPANPQEDTIRQQFNGLYQDSLAKLTDPQLVQKLLAIAERSEALDSQNKHYWTRYGQETLDKLFAKASETYNGQQLSEKGKRQLHSYLVGRMQSDPELQERYENGDPTLVDEVWKEFSSELIEPIRRSAVVQTVERVPHGIPQDTPSVPRATPPSQPANLDERMNLAWSTFNKIKNG